MTTTHDTTDSTTTITGDAITDADLITGSRVPAASVRETYRQAEKLCRQRRVSRLEPGMWVFSIGPADSVWGSWAQITEIRAVLDPATGLPTWHLTCTEHPNGRTTVITATGAALASYLTATQAARLRLAATIATAIPTDPSRGRTEPS